MFQDKSWNMNLSESTSVKTPNCASLNIIYRDVLSNLKADLSWLEIRRRP